MDRLQRIGFLDVAYFIEACFFLFVASLIKVFVPFRYYAFLLGELGPSGKSEPTMVELERLVPVIKAIRRAVKYWPLKSQCLVQALCGSFMLRIRKIPSDIYLGVNKVEGCDVTAHAWLKSGNNFVTGRSGHRQYVVISVFSSRPTSRVSPCT